MLDQQKIDKLERLYKDYRKCIKCDNLCKFRKQVVFGIGRVNADLMIIGEAPGREEDEHGKPFVGEAGTLLADMLQAAGHDLKATYLTTLVMCRPTTEEVGKRGPYLANREPTSDEVKACRERLYEEIYTVDPKLILLLGKAAALTRSRLSLSAIAGKLMYVKIPGKTKKLEISYPAIPTFSPYAILRSSEEKAGSPAMQFREHVKLAANIVRVTKHFSLGDQ